VRRHARFAQLAPRIDAERFHRIVRAEHLVAARLDTGYSARIDNYGCLDLTFASDGEIAVVPYVIVQGIMLFISVSFVLVNLCADLVYAYVDPRIRYS